MLHLNSFLHDHSFLLECILPHLTEREARIFLRASKSLYTLLKNQGDAQEKGNTWKNFKLLHPKDYANKKWDELIQNLSLLQDNTHSSSFSQLMLPQFSVFTIRDKMDMSNIIANDIVLQYPSLMSYETFFKDNCIEKHFYQDATIGTRRVLYKIFFRIRFFIQDKTHRNNSEMNGKFIRFVLNTAASLVE
jgi:hypothetical protein